MALLAAASSMSVLHNAHVMLQQDAAFLGETLNEMLDLRKTCLMHHLSQGGLACFQVYIPPARMGEEQAWGLLSQIVKGCLTVDPVKRLETLEVNRMLFGYMKAQNWSNDLRMCP